MFCLIAYVQPILVTPSSCRLQDYPLENRMNPHHVLYEEASLRLFESFASPKVMEPDAENLNKPGTPDSRRPLSFRNNRSKYISIIDPGQSQSVTSIIIHRGISQTISHQYRKYPASPEFRYTECPQQKASLEAIVNSRISTGSWNLSLIINV